MPRTTEPRGESRALRFEVRDADDARIGRNRVTNHDTCRYATPVCDSVVATCLSDQYTGIDSSAQRGVRGISRARLFTSEIRAAAAATKFHGRRLVVYRPAGR